MAYEIEFTRPALKAFDKLQMRDQRRISAVLDRLEQDPLQKSTRKIAGSDDLFRIQVGDYRIVYRIEDEKLVVLIVRIGHRREVYKGLR